MVADVVSPIYFVLARLFLCWVIFLLLFTLVEGTIFRLLSWGPWKVCLWHALVINLVSTLLLTGTLLVVLINEGSSYRLGRSAVAFLVIIAYGFTASVEAFELRILRRSAELSEIVWNSMTANVASFILVLTLLPAVNVYVFGAH